MGLVSVFESFCIVSGKVFIELVAHLWIQVFLCFPTILMKYY